MNTELWFRPKANDAPFNWCVIQPPGGPTSWIVLPTACSNAGKNCQTCAWNTVINPPGAMRNLNTIYTKNCVYADFNLKLSYRCPNMRTVWTNCNSPILGPRNWGNSGVKIFNISAANGAEIVISDFDWPNTVPYDATAGVGDPVPQAVQGCAVGTDRLVYGQICGAIYDKKVPQAKPPIHPGESAANDPRPNGQNWNTLEIGFMARRYNGAGQVVKLATVTVKINGTRVLHHVGIPISMTNSTQNDDYLAGPKKGDPIYQGGDNWTRECGAIYLQEHDNMIEFKDIRINPDWLPMKDGQFDSGWQRNP